MVLLFEIYDVEQINDNNINYFDDMIISHVLLSFFNDIRKEGDKLRGLYTKEIIYDPGLKNSILMIIVMTI